MRKKKLISVILIFALVFTFMPFNSAAAGTEDIVVREITSGLDYYSVGRFNEGFSEGLAVVVTEAVTAWGDFLSGKYGFIDKTGKVVIPCEYDDAYPFSDGLAMVRLGEWGDSDSKCGYIDKTGKVAIPLEFDWAQPFSEGLAVVRKSDKAGFIDKTGEVVIPFEYDDAYSFKEGLASVKKNGKWGFIDKTGKVVIPFEYYDGGVFSEGLAVVQKVKDGKCVIDKTGKVIVPPFEYGSISSFNDGLARVGGFTYNLHSNTNWGYIDKTGELVLPFEYNEISWFSEGLAYASKDGKDGKDGFVDKTGEFVIVLEPGYYIAWINSFSNGLAGITDPNGKWGFIDKTGKTVVPFEYDWVNPFTEGLAVVKKGGTWSILEAIKVGYPIGDVLYSDITAYINGNAIPTSVIDGKTLVVAEDLARYGFDVKWNGTDRSLKIEPNKGKEVKPLTMAKDTAHKPGTFKCNYLYTDIKTYLSGEEVESFAIDGRTLIDFELLAKYGELTWDGKAREIRVVTDDKFIVFWGQTGTRIHIDPDCRTFSLAVNGGTLDEARAAKRDGWCAACSGGWDDERFLKEGNPHAQKFYANQTNEEK